MFKLTPAVSLKLEVLGDGPGQLSQVTEEGNRLQAKLRDFLKIFFYSEARDLQILLHTYTHTKEVAVGMALPIFWASLPIHLKPRGTSRPMHSKGSGFPPLWIRWSRGRCLSCYQVWFSLLNDIQIPMFSFEICKTCRSKVLIHLVEWGTLSSYNRNQWMQPHFHLAFVGLSTGLFSNLWSLILPGWSKPGNVQMLKEGIVQPFSCFRQTDRKVSLPWMLLSNYFSQNPLNLMGKTQSCKVSVHNPFLTLIQNIRQP